MWTFIVDLILFIISVFTTATTAETTTFDETDDRHAEEEAHEASDLSYELDSVLREIVDLLIFERSHVKLQNNCAGVGSGDGLAR